MFYARKFKLFLALEMIQQFARKLFTSKILQKKLEKKIVIFYWFRDFFSYRNLPYQAWITHAKFHQRRSNGSGGIRGEADLVKVAAVGKDSEKMDA